MGWLHDLLSNPAQKTSPVRSHNVQRALSSIQKFIRSQVVGSIFLLLSAITAIIWANSAWHESYTQLWEAAIGLNVGQWHFSLTLHQWVNEGLMMFFFLVVGLEVKEQILVGELSSARKAVLPVAAALGGMIAPALIYALINGSGEGASGWGIPMATDIAFALGILALLGDRVPLSLKVFLAALAIADDIGAILVITIFYTGEIVFAGLLIALLFWLGIVLLGRLGIYSVPLYFMLSVGVWAGFTISGIHATIGGVLVAIAIPSHCLIDPRKTLGHLLQKIKHDERALAQLSGYNLLRDHEQLRTMQRLSETVREIEPPLVQLERSLQPFVTFVVMPLFALSNAGVPLGGDMGETFRSPVTLGILLGLVIGKPLGITAFTWLMVRFRLADLPDDITLPHIGAISMLAGIGFTVALFITELAFVSNHQLGDGAKLGIMMASFSAGIAGYALLRRLTAQADSTSADAEASYQPIVA